MSNKNNTEMKGQVLIDASEMLSGVIDYVQFRFVRKTNLKGDPTEYVEVYKIDDEYHVRAVNEHTGEYADSANYLEFKTEKFYTTGDVRLSIECAEICKVLKKFFYNSTLIDTDDLFNLFLIINGNSMEVNKGYTIHQMVEFIMNHTDIHYYEEML